MPTIDQNLIAELEKIKEPGPLMAELFKRFGQRAAIGTSGQLTGSALIAMAVEAGAKPRVFTNDTLKLFPETYELFDAIEKKYGLKVERFGPDPKEVQAMVSEYGEFLFFDSKERQELCCTIRKVHPNNRALDSLDVWFTGLRADQSKARAATPKFQIVEHSQGGKMRPILKVAPLVDWTEAKVREYSAAKGVPVHKLLEQKLPGDWYYESLGCMICTTPIGPNEPRRAGRWRWFNTSDDKKECGLHLPAKPNPEKKSS
jgi:phosphoadenosine phosphosulfate reductase